MVEYMNSGGSGFQQFMAARDKNKPGVGSIFIWIAIAMLGGWLISSWLLPDQKQRTVASESAAAVQQVDEAETVPAQTLLSDRIAARVAGLRISEIELKNYRADGSGNIKLLGDPGEFLEVGFLGTGTSVPLPGTLWKINRAASGDPIYMSWKSPEGVEFRRSISMVADYVILVNDTVVNTGRTPITVGQYARIVRAVGETPQLMVRTGGIARAGGEMERETWKSLAKRPHSFHTAEGFIGFTDQYWQTVVRIAGESGIDQTMRFRSRADEMFQADNASESQSIQPGAQYSWHAAIFAGPKNQSDLSIAAAFIPGIDQTIDYGWFWFLARPFLWALNALYDIVGNYGIAIIILTIILRILMWPLTRKSFSSMAAMQKMQPEMQRIQKLYANDKARMQAEMLNLYRTNKTSPMGGCLPMILQIPIFFALYKALLISVPMRQAGFLWISDLAVMDPFFILPVVMGGTMWLQQRWQTAAAGAQVADPSNPAAQMQRMMKWLPLIFTAMFAWMPAGLVLYWTVSNIFGIGQMWVIKKQGS